MKARLLRTRTPDLHRLEFVLVTLLLLVSLLLLFYSPKLNANSALARFAAQEAHGEVTLPALSPAANLFFASPDALLLAAAEVSVDAAGQLSGAASPQLLLGALPTEPSLDQDGSMEVKGQILQ